MDEHYIDCACCCSTDNVFLIHIFFFFTFHGLNVVVSISTFFELSFAFESPFQALYDHNLGT
jgi:hypothetical protein